MANGDDAAAAGMDIVAPTGKVADGYDEINKTRDYVAQRTAAVTPIAKGGTGATTAAAARTNLDVYAKAEAAERIHQHYTAEVINLDAALNGKLNTAGGTITGQLAIPNMTPVSSSYVAVYRNGDGRLGLTPSARRYKTDIADYDGSVLGLRAVTYVLTDDPEGTIRLGIIGDDAEAIEPLLVIRENGEVESFRYELLAVALLADVQRLAARVTELEAG